LINLQSTFKLRYHLYLVVFLVVKVTAETHSHPSLLMLLVPLLDYLQQTNLL
jgi:hypothetical protein